MINKDTLTVEELIPIYLSSMVNQNKESVIYDKKFIFNRFLVPTLGKMKIADITKEIAYQWQDALWATKSKKGEKNYLSSKYLVKIRQMITVLFDFAEERYGITNVLRGVKMPKKRQSKPVMKFWTKEEFQKFIKVVDDPMYHAIFSTLFYTGRRKGEVLALMTGDLGITHIRFNKAISIRTLDGSPYKITSTKADKCYTTPICITLWDELTGYHAQHPFVFGGEKPVSYETLRRKFAEYTKKAGVKPIRIHDLRHSFVSMCIHLGANYAVVADLIGDTVEQVMKTYGHMYETDKERIIDLIG